MPDWKQLVAARLARMKLPAEERGEVVEELAAHLEECYEELREVGSPDPEGYTLAQVPDWKALGRRIQKSKEDPMSVPRKVLIPGLMTLLLAVAVQSILHHLLVWLQGTPTPWQFQWSVRVAGPGAYYLPWLLTLPLAGAMGAWMARRAGARPGQRLTAALFPALFPLAVGIPLLTFVLFADPQKVLRIGAVNFARDLLIWVIVPAIACALGALPLLSGAAHDPEKAPPTQAASA
jgi:hypothetical protein